MSSATTQNDLSKAGAITTVDGYEAVAWSEGGNILQRWVLDDTYDCDGPLGCQCIHDYCFTDTSMLVCGYTGAPCVDYANSSSLNATNTTNLNGTTNSSTTLNTTNNSTINSTANITLNNTNTNNTLTNTFNSSNTTLNATTEILVSLDHCLLRNEKGMCVLFCDVRCGTCAALPTFCVTCRSSFYERQDNG